MATVKYLLKGKGESCSIYIRLLDGRSKDITVLTGYVVNANYWNNEKGIVKHVVKFLDSQNMSKKLDALKLHVLTSLNKDKGTGIEINKQWLINQVNFYKNPDHSVDSNKLLDLLLSYQERLRSKVNPRTKRVTSLATLKNYNTTIKHIKEFQEYINKEIDIVDVDLSFFNTYVEYLSSIKNLTNTTIGTHIKQIKTVAKDAQENGLKINTLVFSSKFNITPDDTLFTTLTEKDIEKIKLFKGSEYLNNARDWLIIGCWTGCRVGDLMKLNNKNIIDDVKGVRFIRYSQSKTNKQVDVPIHQDVKDILEKRSGFPKPISDQRFNDYIKLVCKGSGINEVIYWSKTKGERGLRRTGYFEKWELIKSHTCRRTFATIHYKKLNNKIMDMLIKI